MAYQIGQIPTHYPTPGKTYKVEVENPTGPVSGYSTIAEVCVAGAGANGQGSAGSFTTSSTTEIMAGCKGSITPTRTGKILLIGVAAIRGSDGNNVQITFDAGTGSAPNQGDAVPTLQFQSTSFVTASLVNVGGVVMGIATLIVGTTYWLDLGLLCSFGTTTMTCVNPHVIAVEL